MLNSEFENTQEQSFNFINEYYRCDETLRVQAILQQAALPTTLLQNIQTRAKALAEYTREKHLGQGGIDAFLFEYNLSTNEGAALMCLAEALLRIPDKETATKLLRDKLAKGDWRSNLGKSDSLFVNAATWALIFGSKLVAPSPSSISHEKSLNSALMRLARKGGEPMVLLAVTKIMKILSRRFVMASTIEEAIRNAHEKEKKGYRYSYDMLGESAYTEKDAQKYFQAYAHAIEMLALANQGAGPVEGPGISVKLSALHPCFRMAKRRRIQQELVPRLQDLVSQAKAANMSLTIDAEEAHTLEITLEVVQAVIESNTIGDWQGFGLAVQAYQKRAPFVIDWLIDSAKRHRQYLMVRLVKGAYWDTEIKLSQVQGLSYPVFTRKAATDVNYIVCAKKLLAAAENIYPQFATHNALTVSTIIELAQAQGVKNYEFQCLHGMGEPLYDKIVTDNSDPLPCRIYAPVGTQDELLAYLVRRLLENGANTSFVNRLADEVVPLAEIVADPIEKLATYQHKPHPRIPLPEALFAPFRLNSPGLDLSDPAQFMPVLKKIEHYGNQPFESVTRVSEEMVAKALAQSDAAFKRWQYTSVNERIQCLEKMAVLLQDNQNELLSLLVYEGGKTIEDAVSELREGIDYCHYYASQIKEQFLFPLTLTGPTGEENQLSLHGRGTFACISPWNFPLAIFLGQITACLA